MSAKPVLIVGTGPSGLSLAQALHSHQIPFRIYERDPSFAHRTQGYRIRLNLLGLNALESLVPPAVLERVRETSAAFVPGMSRIDALTGEQQGPAIWTSAAPGGFAPPGPTPIPPAGVDLDSPLAREAMTSLLPVDRTAFRQALATGIEDRIEYSKSFASYTLTESGGVIVHFEDGSCSPEGSLLVGSDGVNSRVARQLAPHANLAPKDMGQRMIYGKSPLTPSMEKSVHPGCLVGGIHFAVDGSRLGKEGASGARGGSAGGVGTLFIETCRFKRPEATEQGNYVYWVLTDTAGFSGWKESDEALFQLSNDDTARLATDFTKLFHPSVRSIVEGADPSTLAVWQMACASPDSLVEWKTDHRITIIGDAVHPVTPVGGLGGNIALHDVRLLMDALMGQTQALARETNGEQGEVGGGWSVETIAAFERKMREEALVQVRMAHAAAVSQYPIPMWKPIMEEVVGGRWGVKV